MLTQLSGTVGRRIDIACKHTKFDDDLRYFMGCEILELVT